jgi:hypothetical protein
MTRQACLLNATTNITLISLFFFFFFPTTDSINSQQSVVSIVFVVVMWKIHDCSQSIELAIWCLHVDLLWTMTIYHISISASFSSQWRRTMGRDCKSVHKATNCLF